MRRVPTPFVVIGFLIAAFCLSAARAWGDPQVSNRSKSKSTVWTVALASARALDAESTCVGYHFDHVIAVRDANPLVHSCGSVIATESASMVATWWADRRLRSSGHTRIANVLMVTTIALEGVFVAHNVKELRRLQRP
jgi:hypothetical protein